MEERMSTVGVRELKKRLTQYLRRTKRGGGVGGAGGGKAVRADPADPVRRTRREPGRAAGPAGRPGACDPSDPRAPQAAASDQGRRGAYFKNHPARSTVNYLHTGAPIKRFVAERGSPLIQTIEIGRAHV